jgi:hypothetical protein
MANTEEKAIDISDFKNLLGIKHKLYEGYLQNDSQEFCRILLEDISRELNEVKGIPIYRILSNSDKISKKLRDNDFYINFNQREKSIITELFYAQIVNIFTCECNSEIYSFQKLLDFPLLFPDNIDDNLITIEELLKLYFEIEYIDFDIECEKCKQKAKHKKEIKISRPPEILILSLQRINESNNSKLRYLVNFPQNLDINEFVDQDCGFARECKYHLFAVINHVGSINSGHYTAIIKNSKKEWIICDDSSVYKIEEKRVMHANAYILFYICKESPYKNDYIKFMKSIMNSIVFKEGKAYMKKDLNFFKGEPVKTTYGDGYVMEENLTDFKVDENYNIYDQLKKEDDLRVEKLIKRDKENDEKNKKDKKEQNEENKEGNKKNDKENKKEDKKNEENDVNVKKEKDQKKENKEDKKEESDMNKNRDEQEKKDGDGREEHNIHGHLIKGTGNGFHGLFSGRQRYK